MFLVMRGQAKQVVAEHMTDDEIRTTIKSVYDVDVAAIKNLSDVAAKLMTDKQLIVPGGLDIKGDVSCAKTVKVAEKGTFGGDLTTSGNIVATGDLVFEGSNRWIIHTPEKGNALHIAPSKSATEFEWTKETKFSRNGDLSVPGKVFEGGNPLMPRGAIIMWSGSVAPAGWALCDGSNGTPDLRGRFVRMFNDTLSGNENEWWKYNEMAIVTLERQKALSGASRSIPATYMLKHRLGDQGGTDHHFIDPIEMPSHTHNLDTYNLRAHGDNLCKQGGDVSCSDANKWTSRTTSAVGSNAGHNSMPPYYVLAFIMKL